MAKAKQRLPLGMRERRAALRKELRASGELPPKKRPLNRRKYITDAVADYNTMWAGDPNGAAMALYSALRFYAALTMDCTGARSLEGVGMAKCVQIAKLFYQDEELYNWLMGNEPRDFDLLTEKIRPIFNA